MRILTLERLRAADPCNAQYELAAAEWPDGIPLTSETAKRAVEMKLDLGWCRHLLTPEQQLEYRRIKLLALAEYDRIQEPALAEYRRIVQPAYAEYERIEEPAWAEYQRIEQPAWDEYQLTLARWLVENL